MASSLIRTTAAALALAGGLSWGCSKERGAAHIARDKDAAPVVVVQGASGTIVATEESEPNDERGAATRLELPGRGRGSLDGESDVDVFALAPKADGILQATLSGIEGVDLMLEIEDEEGKVLARSDRGPAKVVEGLPNLAVIGGKTYYLVVREFVKKRRRRKKGADQPGRQGPSPTYELSVGVPAAPKTGFEKEPNENVDGALELLLGDSVSGYVGWAGDQDMWELSVEGFGRPSGDAGVSVAHSLDVSIDGVDGVSLALAILDHAGKVVVEREADRGQSLFVRNLVPSGEGAHYVARVSGKRSNPEQPYVLRVKTRLLDAIDEREPNDTTFQATALRDDPAAVGGRRRGFLVGGDVDVYHFENGAEPVALSATLRPGADSDLALEILGRGAGALGSANLGKVGGTEELRAVPVSPGQTVWIKVSGSFSGAEPSEYELSWTAEPSFAPASDSLEPELDDLYGE